MKFALTQEVSEQLLSNGVSDHIQSLSNELSEFLKSKNYGNDLLKIYVGIICVSPEFDIFFKVRKPKYKKSKVGPIEDGRHSGLENSLSYDIKLDYNKFTIASESEVFRMLAIEIMKSLVVFNALRIKNFDREQFEKDVVFFLSLYVK